MNIIFGFLMGVASLNLIAISSQAAECVPLYEQEINTAKKDAHLNVNDGLEVVASGILGYYGMGACVAVKGFRFCKGLFQKYTYEKPYRLLHQCWVGGGPYLDELFNDFLEKTNTPRSDMRWVVDLKDELKKFVLERSASGIYCARDSLFDYDQILNDAIQNFIIPSHLNRADPFAPPAY